MKTSIALTIAALAISSNALALDPLAGLPQAVVDAHKALTGGRCDTELDKAASIYDLGYENKFYLVPCFDGAYQTVWNGYITSKNDKRVFPVSVLRPVGTPKPFAGTHDLLDAKFDAKSKKLSTVGLNRGEGDCGFTTVSQLMVGEYGAPSVVTLEIRHKEQCDGIHMKQWPVVFKQ